MLTVYTYSNCDSCRRAVKWLREHAIAAEERPIRETPPTRSQLKVMLALQGGELRKLFNSSGRDFREQRLGEKLPSLSQSEAFDLLSSNGNLVKRPFLIGDGIGLVGFDPAKWSEMLSASAKHAEGG